MMMDDCDAYYADFVSPNLLRATVGERVVVSRRGSSGSTLEVNRSLVLGGRGGGIRVPGGSGDVIYEDVEALEFAADVFDAVKTELGRVLRMRKEDREFVDSWTKRANDSSSNNNKNSTEPYLSPRYETVIGKRDDRTGRVPVGPYPTDTEEERRYQAAVLRAASDHNHNKKKMIEVPPYLKPPMITLFGPPNHPKMTRNAVRAWHRGKETEGPVQKRLVEETRIHDGDDDKRGRPIGSYWGADKEDSVSPLPRGNALADSNLDSVLSADPKARGDHGVPPDHATFPIKRIPGLALPCAAHVLNGTSPIPLHILDFASHAYRNHTRPESLCFYVPKIESEIEARYLNHLIRTVETMIRARFDPSYKMGTVKLLLVFESARAVFRMKEIAFELRDHFVGGSLGWHDYLASVARIMRHDPRYRIPVKKDPNIVLHHIKTSHVELASTMHELGAIAVGGMYGILPEKNTGGRGGYLPGSYQAAMKGYFADVAAQFFRGLDGFWVAHPDFVRLGIAIVAALKLDTETADFKNKSFAFPENGHLFRLIDEVLIGKRDREDTKSFVRKMDRQTGMLDPRDPLYHRALLAADVEVSTYIANDDIEEVKYNIFQALQYLVDWLKGNGCVALPANLERTEDNTVVPVRVMDDLATTERSRWELWHVVFHKLISLDDFFYALREETDFLRLGVDTSSKKIAVPWCDRWYPVAVKILTKLVTDPDPPEFVTELMMPFTTDLIRDTPGDPWETASKIDPNKFRFCLDDDNDNRKGGKEGTILRRVHDTLRRGPAGAQSKL